MTTTTEDITTDDIKLELPCKLAPHELFDIAIRKTETELELEAEEARLDDIKAEFGDRMKGLEKKIAIMREQLHSREERRLVDCYERFVANTIERVRKDTREVFDRRAATMLDNQRRLPAVGSEPKSKSKLAVVPDDGVPIDAPKEAHFNPVMTPEQAANVEVSDDGDVVVPEGDGKRKRKSKSK